MNHLSSPSAAGAFAVLMDKADEPLQEPIPGLEQEPKDPDAFELVELLLKDPEAVDRLNRDVRRQRSLFPRFLLITLTGYLIYASLMVLVLNVAPAASLPESEFFQLPSASWGDGAAFALPFAYSIGIVLAACVCLPTFYFYSLLAGIRMSWLQITSLIGKGMASNAIFLLGLVPVYLIVALGGIIMEAPPRLLQPIFWTGLLLPFLAGVWGLRAIIFGLLDLSSALPAEWQCRRRCFLRRLIISWTGVYAVVVPVMVFRLWEYFAAL